ncbi:stromal cell-derived factor 2 [Chrysoperla carnea]|uniref:stromal cell-derived factor 2 n=1 Tax=Chrysoperla carnea TaxID=189513 RepID=UPI001D078FE0|nr:stromal cell-derived factor 2 [Chrysoperla carnea]
MININNSLLRNSVLLIFFLNINCWSTNVNAAKQRYVTCGTVLKLMNSDLQVRLHSHDVKYGTGSGQQSVTGTELTEDVNSHWLVKAGTGKLCNRGEPIKCGSIIRLEHLATHKNLHSHRFESPLSGGQEISCYGSGDGEGDSGDHWELVCSGDKWLRDESVMLKHVETDKYLCATGRAFGRPISGQIEIAGVSSLRGSVYWKAAEGLFLHAPEPELSHTVHTEL